MTRSSLWPLVIVTAFALAACGGGDDSIDSPAATPDDDASSAEPADPPADPPADDPATGGTDGGGSGDGGTGSDAPVPIVRYAAHGPDAANTIGTGCADGIDTRGGDLYRFTPPGDYTWKGTSGGTGPDEVSLWSETDHALLFVAESANSSETRSLDGWMVVGPTGTDIAIDGVTIPVMEISYDGAPGYAIVDLDYLSPIPMIDAALGTVAVTSDTEGRPTLDEAVQLLETVRVERCAAISEAFIWGSGGGFRPVPRFEPDPLGKTWPDEPQPAFDPTVNPLVAYSPAQLAYLMPVEAGIADCVAAAAIENFGDNPIGYLMMLAPSGTNKADLEAIVAGC